MTLAGPYVITSKEAQQEVRSSMNATECEVIDTLGSARAGSEIDWDTLLFTIIPFAGIGWSCNQHVGVLVSRGTGNGRIGETPPPMRLH